MVLALFGVLLCILLLSPNALFTDERAVIAHPAVSVRFEKIQEEYANTDVTGLISIKSSDDVFRKRDALISFLWGNTGLPVTLPLPVNLDLDDPYFSDIAGLQRIERIVVSMEFGLQSVVYHFIPEVASNKAVVFHQGHHGPFHKSKKEVAQFIERGFNVVAFSMPLLGFNNQPTVDISGLGKLKITSHDHMKYLSPEKGHPIKYFIEPVVILLNYLERRYDFASVSMVGISGGGWTTTLAAAVDTRIDKSYPIAGSYPIYLRSNSHGDWGDYEQNNPDLYGVVNYLELYVLGSHGRNRKQLQMLNQYDPCCFAGVKWKTYRDIIVGRIDELGVGEFDLFMDDSHQEHKISKVAMERILGELENSSHLLQVSGASGENHY